MARTPEFPSVLVSEGAMERRSHVLTRLTPFVEKKLDLLLDPKKAWQPSLVLPDPQSSEFRIIQELLKTWDVKSIPLSGQADEERNEMVSRADRLTKIAERARPRGNSDALEALKQRWTI
ncbi:MAG TPA: hypothetical protein PKA38_03340 [Candidatus Levybacteria bacterium]|nr:hypothetical protein [Candidatus Levybacteria bacterium]